jgi:hypothetical protein
MGTSDGKGVGPMVGVSVGERLGCMVEGNGEGASVG